MGIENFFTFVDQNLFSPIVHAKSVDLTDGNVIIDGNSFLYFFYNKTNTAKVSHLTTTKVDYDICCRTFFYALKKFKEKCAIVHVVFDGIFNRKKYKRVRSSEPIGSKVNLPATLIYEEFSSILRYLQIPIHVAQGEADSLVVEMARQNYAYIVADDSDYHLYKFDRGYVPLYYFSLDTFRGRLYHIADIFYGIDENGVALWATTMAFNFIDLDALKVN